MAISMLERSTCFARRVLTLVVSSLTIANPVGLNTPRFQVIPEIYICRASGGAGEVNNFETIPAAA
jgi:hypothetical protein